MKTVVWTGEARVLPGYGLAIPGGHVTLPDNQAASYVIQGLAEFEAPPKVKSMKEKED